LSVLICGAVKVPDKSVAHLVKVGKCGCASAAALMRNIKKRYLIKIKTQPWEQHRFPAPL